MLNSPKVEGKGYIFKHSKEVNYFMDKLKEVAKELYSELTDVEFQEKFDELMPGKEQELDRLIEVSVIQTGMTPKECVEYMLMLLNLELIMKQA